MQAKVADVACFQQPPHPHEHITGALPHFVAVLPVIISSEADCECKTMGKTAAEQGRAPIVWALGRCEQKRKKETYASSV